MKQEFKTPVNTNGNSYGLIINHNSKTYSQGWGLTIHGVKVRKKDIKYMIIELKGNGHIEC